MKKRKRAPAQPRRDPSSPEGPSEVDGKTPATQSEGAALAQEAAPSEGAPAEPEGSEAAADGGPAEDAAPAPEPATEAAPAEGKDVWAAEETAGVEEAAQASPPSGETPLSDDGEPAATAAAGEPGEDDSGWEDAPTRELDVGNMEFAATWTDVHDTLPNVDPESDTQAAPDGEGTPEGESPEDGEALPTDTWRVESILESLLFATDRPLSVSDLKRLLAVKDAKIVTDALGALRDRRADSGIQLISVAGGWQLRTHPANGAWVAKLVAGRPQRLSRAMMETLAIVAYRQPITRPEIDEIRGVDCGPVLRTLLDRNLIRIIGKKEEVGRPMLYGTTPEFLKTFSLRDLTELPTLREFHELGADEKAQVDKKMPRPEGDGAAEAAGLAGETPLRPSTVDLPQADPVEDDELFDALDRASEAAARASDAAAPPAEDAKPGEQGEPATAAGVGES